MTLGRSVVSVAKRHYSRVLHTPKGNLASSHQSQPDMDHLFCYTSGRWLWNEREQLEARYRRFDIPGLQQAACQAAGASRCVSFEKIGEGNYNKAYRLEMEDGKRVIAKIPHPNAGPRMLTTASEVATMEFARNILEIPVPRVLAWSATDKNPVQSEYIIMEEAGGHQLHEVWPQLPLRKRCDIIREFVDVEAKLLSVSFEKCVSTYPNRETIIGVTYDMDRLGSLYLKESDVAGCEPAIVTTGPQHVIGHVESTYCIGPVARREFWANQRSELEYHGPCKFLKECATRI